MRKRIIKLLEQSIMNTYTKWLNSLWILTLLVVVGCETESDSSLSEVAASENSSIQPIINDVLSKEERDNLTPGEILNILMKGNNRFVNNDLTSRDHSIQIRKAAQEQFPKAIILSCFDSRIPVEDVFDRGIGDLLVLRVGGNVLNDDILASLEYGVINAGAKIIMVLGHEKCETVIAAIENIETGHMPSLVEAIEPSMDKSKSVYGPKSKQNVEYVQSVVNHNVANTLENIKSQSPLIRRQINSNNLMVVGGVYDMQTGTVRILE